MIFRLRHKGFSLVEVMMSAAILAIGFVLIAGAFPVGVKLTAVATERTIGLAASSEAFAKIKLYGVDFADSDWPGVGSSVDFSYIADAGINLDLDIADFSGDADAMDAAYAKAFEEYNYPSTYLVDEKKYRWSALCRRLGDNKVQVTVFVCRIGGPGVLYPEVDIDGILTEGTTDYPKAIAILRKDPDKPSDDPAWTDSIIDIDTNDPDIPDGVDIFKYVKAGSTLVDDKTGSRMEVIERDVTKLYLLNPVDEGVLGGRFWVIPPSVRTDLRVDGRYPCVAVYQQAEITF